MHMNPWDQTQYPKFAAYMRDSFPKIIDVPNIVRGMQNWGHMTLADVKLALEWQGGNTYTSMSINITEPYFGEDWVKQRQPEVLRPTIIVTEVPVSPRAAQAFEDGKGVSITGYGRKVYAIGAQILGQIVYNSAINNYPDRGARSTPEQRAAYAQQRRHGFFAQVYGGAPR